MQPSISVATGKEWHPRTPGIDAYLAQLPISILCWTSFVVLESGWVFIADALRGYILPLSHYLTWAAFNWYSWAFLTPAVLALARHYPITRTNWAERIFVPHAFACFGCVLIQAVLRGIAGWIYTLHHEVQTPLLTLIFGTLEDRGLLGVLAYWTIIAIAAFIQLREQIRLRDLRQAQLETRLASAELEMLRMQLHPHFLFNTLQAAITLVQDDPRAAEDVLLRLSQLLRITLDQMGTNEIPLARELEFLDLYIGIQRQRFGDRLMVEIHAEASTLDRQVPPLLLQPLVENAIHHGIGKHKGEDLIEIHARMEKGGLELEVCNANSVVEDSSERLFLRGVGLRNTRARIQHLYGSGASLILHSLGRRGATARIFIPAQRSQPAIPRPTVQTAP
ncbi:MAG TPA: histidine kinase [Silvibacterium sp.]|nr:histidine kinase [Silvibacterium sp.]